MSSEMVTTRSDWMFGTIGNSDDDEKHRTPGGRPGDRPGDRQS